MWQDRFQEWLQYSELSADLRQDLQGKSESELQDMFYTSLAFGTGGMRGVLGAGTNRLNIYTIRKANDGLARYLLQTQGEAAKQKGVCIAYDNRRMSKEFALESAKVLGYYGIRSFLFDDLRPTPELSFAVRYLGCAAGIVVTASHNPPQYNGYKIYDQYGCQFTPEYADIIISMVESVADLFQIGTVTEETLRAKKLLTYVGKEIDDAYLALVKTIALHPELPKTIKIVFTPLHGTSAKPATRLLKETGYTVFPVESQMVHDPLFSTVKSPNPENPSAFELAKVLGHQVHADLLIATDPDADRLGIAVKEGADYRLMSGNQTGAVLLYYLLSQQKALGILAKHGVVFNTIVTSDLGAKIARHYGMNVISTLTGFKFIGEQARLLEKTNQTFVFGYEESYGYVIKDFVRDKDSLQALLLASEAANYYQQTEGKTLFEKLQDLFMEFGFHQEALHNIDLFGMAGAERIERIVDWFRNNPLSDLNGISVAAIEDFRTGWKTIGSKKHKLEYPSSNVVKYLLKNGDWFVLRPSGTEPKLKIYVGVTANSQATCEQRNSALSKTLLDLVGKIQ